MTTAAYIEIYRCLNDTHAMAWRYVEAYLPDAVPGAEWLVDNVDAAAQAT